MKNILYLFSITTIVAVFYGFKIQESQIFYYAFDEKIFLDEVENKLVIIYSENIKKDIASGALKKSYATSQQIWHDDRTVVLSIDSKTNRNGAIEALRRLPETVTCQPLYKINTGLEMIVTDEFVVKFKDNILAEQQREIHQMHGVSMVKSTDIYQLLKVSKGADALHIANKYQESGLVEFSHPNFISKVEKHQQVIPNDPYFVNQFTLHNTGQVFNDDHFGTVDADIDAPEAWAMTTGVNNILIAVLDDGVTPNHPDLPNARQVRLNGSNFADGNPNDPSPVGNLNHGNACAGVIAATMNNNQGIAGICPNCRVMPIRVFDSNENSVLSNRMADAINFAVDNGADIISNSWGYDSQNPNFYPVIVTAIQRATTQGRMLNGVARGCVVLFSAGNNPTNNGIVHFPANVNIPGVLTVGASDRNDLKSFYSPLGNPASTNNQVLDVTAPSNRAFPGQIAGETAEAWTIDIPGNVGSNPWPAFTSPGRPSFVPPAIGEQLPNAGLNFLSYTGRFGGTSHSCPVVAGVAALVLSVNPNLTQQQVFNIITSSANQVGGYVYTNGRSNELGFGRVNACRSVMAAFNTIATIATNGPICTSTTLTTSNRPPNSTVTWASSVPTGLSVNANTGLATRMNNYNGNVTVTATITGPGNCSTFAIQKTIFVGLPLANMNTLIFPSGQRGVNPVTLGPASNYTFNVDFVPAATSFTWVLPTGFSFVSGSTTSTPVIKTSSTNGTYTLFCKANNACGSSWTNSLTINIGSGGGGTPQFIVYPNPAQDEFSVSYVSDFESTSPKFETDINFSATLFDFMNKNVKSNKSEKGKAVFDVRNQAPGLYVLKIQYNNEVITRHVMIKK